MPLSFAGATASFKADVLGGEGSLCPALLSNPALRKQKACILSDWFQNGEGCVVVWNGPADGQRRHADASNWHYLRLLLTDSGHYLLPVNDHRELAPETVVDVDCRMSF